MSNKIKKLSLDETESIGFSTSFWDNVILCSFNDLKGILGPPTFEDEPFFKITYQWDITLGGSISPESYFNIYDWKRYGPLPEDMVTLWHIGCNNKSTSLRAQSILFSLLGEDIKEASIRLERNILAEIRGYS